MSVSFTLSENNAAFALIHRSRWHLLANLTGTNDYRDSERYHSVTHYNVSHSLCLSARKTANCARTKVSERAVIAGIAWL